MVFTSTFFNAGIFAASSSLSSIVVKVPALPELDAINGLNTRVSYEYFKPFYRQPSYASFVQGKDTDGCLEKEIAHEYHQFAKILKSHPSDEALLVAYSDDTPVGLIWFHTEDGVLVIDLLLVDANTRGLGVGSRLVLASLRHFQGIKVCDVYPYRFDNADTLKFYEKMGFRNIGLAPEGFDSHGTSRPDTCFHYRLGMIKN